MSFYLTTPQMRARTKTVTRRLKSNVQPGELLMACVKCMGLRKGQKVEHIHPIKVLDVRREPLNAITQEECALEGFPDLSPQEFVEMFCKAMACIPSEPITRIQFEHL
jgi:hypothetical protein